MVFPWTGVIRLFSLINLAVLDFDFHVTNLLFTCNSSDNEKKKKINRERERKKKSERQWKTQFNELHCSSILVIFLLLHGRFSQITY